MAQTTSVRTVTVYVTGSGQQGTNSEHLSVYPFVITLSSQNNLFDLLDCGLAEKYHKVVLDLAHSEI